MPFVYLCNFGRDYNRYVCVNFYLDQFWPFCSVERKLLCNCLKEGVVTTRNICMKLFWIWVSGSGEDHQSFFSILAIIHNFSRGNYRFWEGSSIPKSLWKEAAFINISSSCTKIVSMIRKYHNHKLQTNPWHREEEPHNNHETPGRQIKQSNQLSL